MIKVACCIVTFNPDKIRLKENLSAIYNQVDIVYVVDNNSQNLNEIIELVSEFENSKLIKLNDNLGIAKALNVGCENAFNDSFEYIITLDQDTVCRPNLIDNYKKHINDEVAMMHCKSMDRNVKNEIRLDNVTGEIQTCITSASFVKLQVWKEVCGFDEKMFIDCVDFDFCYMIKKYGYKIIRINFEGFLHELGNATSHKIFGKRFNTTNHSSLRVYYIIRNELYIMRKYKEVSFLKTMIEIQKRTFKIVFFEKNKIKKYFSIVKGFIVGATMKINYQDEEK